MLSREDIPAFQSVFIEEAISLKPQEDSCRINQMEYHRRQFNYSKGLSHCFSEAGSDYIDHYADYRKGNSVLFIDFIHGLSPLYRSSA